MKLWPSDYHYIRLLELSPFEQRRGSAERSGGWRFGTRRIADSVVSRLTASGRAATDGQRVWLVKRTS